MALVQSCCPLLSHLFPAELDCSISLLELIDFSPQVLLEFGVRCLLNKTIDLYNSALVIFSVRHQVS